MDKVKLLQEQTVLAKRNSKYPLQKIGMWKQQSNKRVYFDN
jgi:hypothetical protein